MCECCPACKATGNEKGVPRIEVTPQMIDAGIERLVDLQDSAGSAYVVEEIYLAMERARVFSRLRSGIGPGQPK